VKKFRIPRKLKKRLTKKFLFYPADEKGNSLMASPNNIKEDFEAYQKGILRSLISRKISAEKKQLYKELKQEVFVPGEKLFEYVNGIFAKEYRRPSFDILKRAKEHKKAKVTYYEFINAYRLYDAGDKSMGNLCCMIVDDAKRLMNKRKKNTPHKR